MSDRKIRAFYEYRRKKNSELHVARTPVFDFPPHLHEDVELLFMHKGSMEVLVGTQWHPLSEGELAIVFPNTVHAFRQKDSDTLFTIVICAPSLIGDTFSRLLRHTPTHPFLAADAIHPDILYAIEGLHAETEGNANLGVFKALIRLILARALEHMDLLPIDEPQGMDLTARLADYLSHHYHEAISLESVAKELGVSRYHISHVFSNRFKTGFTDYLNSLRLSRACDLMATEDMSLSTIGMEAGFSSQRTFNRAFQKHYGLSPREYRRQMQR